jgi:hypothetical protein
MPEILNDIATDAIAMEEGSVGLVMGDPSFFQPSPRYCNHNLLRLVVASTNGFSQIQLYMESISETKDMRRAPSRIPQCTMLFRPHI